MIIICSDSMLLVGSLSPAYSLGPLYQNILAPQRVSLWPTVKQPGYSCKPLQCARQRTQRAFCAAPTEKKKKRRYLCNVNVQLQDVTMFMFFYLLKVNSRHLAIKATVFGRQTSQPVQVDFFWGVGGCSVQAFANFSSPW